MTQLRHDYPEYDDWAAHQLMLEQEEQERCDYCKRFFAMYRCNAPDECDCPKCQGYCECGEQDAE